MLVEKMLVGLGTSMAGLLVGVAGWKGFHELCAVAWAWRGAITAHAAWSN